MIYIFLFITLLITELVYFKLADRFNIIDIPTKRSSHSRTTLRGGGIVFYISIVLYFLFKGFNYPYFFLGLTLITIISFADDIHSLSIKPRLLVQVIAMSSMLYQWNLFMIPWQLDIVIVIFGIGILNAFNFMDGINGLTGGYCLLVAGALCYINLHQVTFVDNELIYAFMLGLLSFTIFNFRTKTHCFAGDVGAFSAGFILLFVLGKLIIRTGDLSYLILLGVYGVDVVLTIMHRLMLKENIFVPHRMHLHQLMVNELGIPHVKVSLLYIATQAAIIVGLFMCQTYPYTYSVCVVVLLSAAYILFIKKYFHLHTELQPLLCKKF